VCVYKRGIWCPHAHGRHDLKKCILRVSVLLACAAPSHLADHSLMQQHTGELPRASEVLFSVY
jgi:hypothetical protein